MADVVDLSEFNALAKRKDRPDLCLLARHMVEMDREDARKLEAALQAGYPTAIIARWLKQRGRAASEQVVRLHRTGACCCVDHAA